MPLIKCSDCGKEISDRSKVCIHCGCPIEGQESRLIVYGVRQNYLLGAAIKLYRDGQMIAKVPKGGKFEIDVDKDFELSVKCGINPSSPKIEIRSGKLTKIQIVCDRLLGTFRLEEIDFIVNGAQI